MTNGPEALERSGASGPSTYGPQRYAEGLRNSCLRRSTSRSTRYYNVITGKRLLPAALACTYAKTPFSAFPLVTGSLGTSYRVPPAGFEPAHTAPEAVALSPELRGRVGRGDRGDG